MFGHGGLQGVFCGLVVVWERDDGRADAEDHGRVDLAVRVFHEFVGQVAHVHGDHCVLFLLHIQELHEPLPPEHLKSKPINQIGLLHLNLIIRPHHNQRPHTPSRIRIDLNLLLTNIPHNGHLKGYLAQHPHPPQPANHIQRLIGRPNPIAIQHNLRLRQDFLRVGVHIECRVLCPADFVLEPVVLLVEHAAGDIGHERDVLDDADLLALWGLAGADHSEVGVV